MRGACAGSQTVGPFFRIGLSWLCATPEPSLVPGSIAVSGCVLDGAGNPVQDAMLEFWRADPQGHYSTEPPQEGACPAGCPSGFTRVASDEQGCFTCSLSKPGPVEFGDGRTQAPHLVVLVFARGLLRHLITRMYFPGEAANHTDPILQLVPPRRRPTLIARSTAEDPNHLKWNVVLQGDEETVFFAW